ncbi:MAG: hypothetical protein KDD82_23175 [Planctomycetes bacterium]|nr:hypothetical protein [Planctomycetota bacterium]
MTLVAPEDWEPRAPDDPRTLLLLVLPGGVGICELRLAPPEAELTALLARAPAAPPTQAAHPSGVAVSAEVRYPAEGAVQLATLVVGRARVLCSLTGDATALAAQRARWQATLDSLRFLRELDAGFAERVASALGAQHPSLSLSAVGADRVRIRLGERAPGTWWLRDLLRAAASAEASAEPDLIEAACAAFDPAALEAPDDAAPTADELFPALYAADDPQASETLTRLVAPWLRVGIHAGNALRPRLLGPVELAPLGHDVDSALHQALRNLEQFVAEVPLSGSEGDDGLPELLDFSGFAYLGAAFLMPSFPARTAAALGPACELVIPARDVLLAYRTGHPKLTKHVHDMAERTRRLSLEPLPPGAFVIQDGKAEARAS